MYISLASEILTYLKILCSGKCFQAISCFLGDVKRETGMRKGREEKKKKRGKGTRDEEMSSYEDYFKSKFFDFWLRTACGPTPIWNILSLLPLSFVLFLPLFFFFFPFPTKS
jgi:hypothetical protein